MKFKLAHRQWPTWQALGLRVLLVCSVIGVLIYANFEDESGWSLWSIFGSVCLGVLGIGGFEIALRLPRYARLREHELLVPSGETGLRVNYFSIEQVTLNPDGEVEIQFWMPQIIGRPELVAHRLDLETPLRFMEEVNARVEMVHQRAAAESRA